jgi:hypothetical protein
MKRHASMNRIYRLVWSPIHKVWIPVAEIARGRSKGSSRKLFAAALSLTAAVGHTEPIGGLLGYNSIGTLTANFWDVTKSGKADGLGIGRNASTVGVAGTPQAGVTGLATVQMHAQASFTANDATKTHDGLAYNGSGGVTYSVTPNMANLLGNLSYGGTSQGAVNVGSCLITPSGLSSGNYTLSYVNGVLTVNPAAPAKTGSTDSGRPSEPVRNVTSLLTASLTSPHLLGTTSPERPASPLFLKIRKSRVQARELAARNHPPLTQEKTL